MTDVFANLRGVPTGDPRWLPSDALLRLERITIDGFFKATGIPPLKPLLTVWEADRAAIAAGFHPAEVWPQWFDDDDQRATT